MIGQVSKEMTKLEKINIAEVDYIFNIILKLHVTKG